MRVVLLYILLFISLLASAQRITNFNLITAGTSIAVRFTISQGVQCNGYTIYHGTDSVNFKVVSDNPGTCGSTSEDQSISITHQDALVNRVNYYKVDLFPVETSRVLGIFLPDQNHTGISVYPNPLLQQHENLKIKFSSLTPVNLKGFIYNQSGEPMRPVNLNTANNDQTVALDDFRNGLYLIRLSDGLKTFSAKFVILR